MARNVGKTQLEENLGKSISRHQGKLMLVVGLVVLGLFLFSSQDYFREYSGIVEAIGEDKESYTVRKTSHRSFAIWCASVRLDGDAESTKICQEDPSEFQYLRPRTRFVKPRFQRFMRSEGGEVPVPWLTSQAGTGAASGSAAPVPSPPPTPSITPPTPPAEASAGSPGPGTATTPTPVATAAPGTAGPAAPGTTDQATPAQPGRAPLPTAGTAGAPAVIPAPPSPAAPALGQP